MLYIGWWLVAVIVVGLFALGSWMVTLDYYSQWYQTGQDVHRGVGVILFILLLSRFLIRIFSPPPNPLPNLTQMEHISARIVHWTLYLLPLVTIITGYLISMADGRGVDVFGLFAVPATFTSIENQEDICGKPVTFLQFPPLLFPVCMS